MRQVTAELTVYVIDDGSRRRLYCTERCTRKETPYFYIKNNKAEYLTTAEVSEIPASWMGEIPIRNN